MMTINMKRSSQPKKKAEKEKEKAPIEKKNEVGAFDYINSVLRSKINLMRGTDNDVLAEKGYVPFLTNKALSFHSDTVLYANEMNQRGHLDNRLQYEYLLGSVRSMSRNHGWLKKQEAEAIQIIQERCNVNPVRAKEIYSIVGDAGVDEMKRSMIKGGVVK